MNVCSHSFSFREFRFTSEVPIWLDYQGKHVVIEQVGYHLSPDHLWFFVHVVIKPVICVVWVLNLKTTTLAAPVFLNNISGLFSLTAVISDLWFHREHLQAFLLVWPSWTALNWSWRDCAVDMGKCFHSQTHLRLYFLPALLF